MTANQIIKKVKTLCKRCNLTVFICEDKEMDDKGLTAGYSKGEICIYTKGKSDNWVAVHLLHEFCHYLQEAHFVFHSGYPLGDKYYEHNTFLVEINVEFLTYKWLVKWRADPDVLKECRVLTLENLRNYC